MPPRFSISDLLVGPSGEAFLRDFSKRSYPKRGLVCSGEEDENGVFVVMSGRLRMYLTGSERELSLFYFGPGDLFCTHSGCLVEAEAPSELRFADMPTFERKLREKPEIAWVLISLLGRALASFRSAIETLMFRDIGERVGHFFLDQARSHGALTPEGVKVEVRLSVEEIAKSIGSSRPATSTAINGLIRDGVLVRSGRGQYTIPSLEKLKSPKLSSR